MEIELNERGVIRLQNNLAKLGFTLFQPDFTVLAARLPENVQEFVDAIFVAEGMNPHSVDRNLWRQVRDAVINAHDQSIGG